MCNGVNALRATELHTTKWLTFHVNASTIFKKDFIYLFMRYTEKGRERQRHRQREKQAPWREPDAELDQGTPGRPGPKAGAKLLSHPGIPSTMYLKKS